MGQRPVSVLQFAIVRVCCFKCQAFLVSELKRV